MSPTWFGGEFEQVELDSSTRVLVLGGTGFLGSNVCLSASRQCALAVHGRSQFSLPIEAERYLSDLTSESEVRAVLHAARPDVVVNCVALADVDRCESDRSEAERLNVRLPFWLANVCRDSAVQLVHVSTDAVFGDGEPPYTETSQPSPINEYGRSKLRGESEVLAADGSALVVRTNIVGWSPSTRRSLLEFFVNRFEAGEEARGFTDVWFRPLSILRFWPLVREFVDEAVRLGVGGIRHATGSELVSKFEFGRMVADVFGFDQGLVVPSSVHDVGLAAPRGSRLDVVPTPRSGSAVVPAEGVRDDLIGLREVASRGWRRQVQEFQSSGPRRSP